MDMAIDMAMMRHTANDTERLNTAMTKCPAAPGEAGLVGWHQVNCC